jgi:hypothetical protein
MSSILDTLKSLRPSFLSNASHEIQPPAAKPYPEDYLSADEARASGKMDVFGSIQIRRFNNQEPYINAVYALLVPADWQFPRDNNNEFFVNARFNMQSSVPIDKRTHIQLLNSNWSVPISPVFPDSKSLAVWAHKNINPHLSDNTSTGIKSLLSKITRELPSKSQWVKTIDSDIGHQTGRIPAPNFIGLLQENLP